MARLGPGASAQDVEAFRGHVGDIDLGPAEDLLALHAWRDGHRRFDVWPEDPTLIGPTMNGKSWTSLASIARRKADWDELAQEFDRAAPDAREYLNGALWHTGWLPFLESDSEVIALSTVPCFGGPAGQVLRFDFKGGSSWWVEHASFADWLETTAAIVEAGLVDRWPHEDEDRSLLRYHKTPRRLYELMAALGPRRFHVQPAWVAPRVC